MILGHSLQELAVPPNRRSPFVRWQRLPSFLCRPGKREKDRAGRRLNDCSDLNVQGKNMANAISERDDLATPLPSPSAYAMLHGGSGRTLASFGGRWRGSVCARRQWITTV